MPLWLKNTLRNGDNIMLEKDMLAYLQSQTALTTLLGGVEKIVVAQTPVGSTMSLPWLIINVSSGTRKQITQSKIEVNAQIRITVECGAIQTVKGRSAIELALKAVEHIRGTFGDEQDCYITCSGVRSDMGVISVTRYQFDAQIRYTEAYTKPPVV